jgi:hypothetical protein
MTYFLPILSIVSVMRDVMKSIISQASIVNNSTRHTWWQREKRRPFSIPASAFIVTTTSLNHATKRHADRERTKGESPNSQA